MEKLDYDELKQLLLNGDISIQDPIMVYDASGETSKKCPFERYLQEYEDFDEKNSLEKTHDLYDLLRNRVNKLDETPEVKTFVIDLNDQWIEPDRQLHVENVIPEGFFQKQNRGVENYQRACGLCDRIDGSCSNTPESSFTGEHPVHREADGVIDLCGQVREYIEDNMEDIKKMLMYFRGFDTSLFLDLSKKHKSLYFNNNDSNDIIPNNIHIIFSNFLLLHNMFTKQLIQYYKYLHGLLQELDERCQKMNILKESNPVEQYDVLNILKNLLGLSENGDEEKENEDLDETLEVPDYSEESDEVVDDEYDKVSETYNDSCSIDLEDDDDDEQELEDDNDEQDLEDDNDEQDLEDDKEKKEIKMLIQDYSDDEDELNKFF